MPLSYFTKGELKKQQQYEQQEYVDKVVLPKVNRQTETVGKALADFGSGKLQDYDTIASLPSEIQSYRQGLTALHHHGYAIDNFDALNTALTDAENGIKNWASQYKNADEYKAGYYYPMKYKDATSKDLDASLRGLNQQLSALPKSSTKKTTRQTGDVAAFGAGGSAATRAGASNAEADPNRAALLQEIQWIKDNRNMFLTSEELDATLSKTKAELESLKKKMGDSVGSGEGRTAALHNRVKELESQVNSLAAYKDQRTTAQVYNSLDAEGKNAFDHYKEWEKVIDSAQNKGARYLGRYYTKEADGRYRINGTNSYAESDDEKQYAEALSGYLGFRRKLRQMGYDGEQIESIADRARKQYNAKIAQSKQEKAAEFAKNHEVLASIASVPMSLISGIGYLDQLGQFITGGTDALTGEKRLIDPNTAASRIGLVSSTYRDVIANELADSGAVVGGVDVGKIGSFLYQTGMSIADFLTPVGAAGAVAKVGKAVGAAETASKIAGGITKMTSPLLGGAAASQTLQDARARGATDGQAITLATLSGIAEGLFEQVSLDKLKMFQSTMSEAEQYTLRQAVLDVAKQGLVEGSEEAATTLANTVSDLLIMADKNSINQTVSQLMLQGYTRDQAEKMAWNQWWGQLGMDALAGALSGVAISGVGSGAHRLSNAVLGQAVFDSTDNAQAGTMSAQSYINAALSDKFTKEDSTARKIANHIAENYDDLSKLPKSEMGRLVRAFITEQRENALSEVRQPKTLQQKIAEENQTKTVMTNALGTGTTTAVQLSRVSETMLDSGVTAKDAVKYAPVVERIVAGLPVSDQQLDSLDLRDTALADALSKLTGVEIDAAVGSLADLRAEYRAAIKAQAEKVEALNEEQQQIAAAQADLTAAQVANAESAQAEAASIMDNAAAQVAAEPGRMQLDAAATTGATAAQPIGDTVELLNPDGSVNQMTREEFKESARLAQAPFSDEELDAQFDSLVARYQSEGGPISPAAAVEAAPAEAVAPEAAQAPADAQEGPAEAEPAPEAAGETEAEPVQDSEDAPDGVTFRAMEGGVQELTNEQKWAAALAYRVLKKLGVKRIIWDEARCGLLQRASVTASNGTIYLNPRLLTARGVILRAIGHEITHPATEDKSRNDVNPMAEKIISAVQKLAGSRMIQNLYADQDATANHEIRESLLAMAEQEELNGNADRAEQLRKEAEQVVPENLLWQAEHLGEIRKAMLSRYKDGLRFMAAQAEANGNTAQAAQYRKEADQFDEHNVNQEIAGDWIGMLFEYPELMERLAGEEIKLPTKILRLLSRMRYGSALSILSDEDKREAKKQLDGLMNDVNKALKKSELKKFQSADKAKPKPGRKKADSSGDSKVISRLDRVAEARKRAAEKAKAEREAAGEEIPEQPSRERSMFVGEKSRLADLEALKTAQDFEKNGMSPDQIRIVTGWFRGADNKWRYEIADNKMTLRTKGSARIYNDYPEYREFSDLELRVINGETLTDAEQKRMEELGKTMIPLRKEMNKEARKRLKDGTATLSDVLVHPELFEAYPELANMRVHFHEFTPAEGGIATRGFFDPSDFHIEINTKAWGMDNEQMRKTLSHELQHAVQNLEGFASGGNSTWWGWQKRGASDRNINARSRLNDKNFRRLMKWQTAFDDGDQAQMDRILNAVEQDGNANQTAWFRRAIGAYQLGQDPRSDYELYQDTAGEREARDTASRLERTSDQRLRERPDFGENPVFTEDPDKINKPIKAPKKEAPKAQERFSFVGPKSKRADLDALKTAQRFEKAGKDAEKIRVLTGWFRGMDDKWRYEIPDNDSRLRLEDAAEKIEAGTAKLSDVLDHPELYEAYPELRDVSFAMQDLHDPTTAGAFDRKTNRIILNTGVENADTRDRLADLMHEVQHKIQQVEGFARGSDPDTWRRKRIEAEEEEIFALGTLTSRNHKLYQEWLAARDDTDLARMIEIERRVAKWKNEEQAEAFQTAMGARMLADDFRTDVELYENTAGEVEARDVEERLRYTPEERAGRSPARAVEPRFAEDPYRYTPTEEAPEAQALQGMPRYSFNEPLKVQVLRAMYNRGNVSDAVDYGEMPDVLKAVGLDDRRLLMWSSHLNQMGKPKSPDDPHAHGITDEQAVQLQKELEKPVLIFDPRINADTVGSSTVAVVTSMLDPDGLPIIAYVTDRGNFTQIDLEATGATPQEVENVGAIRTAYGYGKNPADVQQPTPEDAGFVDDHTFTKLMLDALASDDVLFVNHERLRDLESRMKDAQNKLSAPGEAAGHESDNFTETLPSAYRRSGTEVPGGLYTLPNGTIIHKSRNLVKYDERTGDEVQRYAGPNSLAPAEPERRYQIDPDAYRRFFSDLYERRGLTEQAAAASARRTPEQRVSQFRTNTLRHSDDLFDRAELRMDGLREEDNTYDVLSNIESMRRAKDRLHSDYDGTLQDLTTRGWRSAEDLDAGMGILAVKIAEARATGDYTAAIDWAHIIRDNGTAAGQFVQAFAKYSQTPEGVLLNAVDALEQSGLSQEEQDALLDQITDFANTLHALKRGEEGDRDDLIDLILRQAEVRNTPVSNQTLKDLGMQKIDYLYDAALSQMDQIAKDYVKSSAAKGLATFQTIAHLFNFKTANRNLVSNTAFSPLAAVANNLALIPDVVTSAFTGRRGVGLDKWWFSKQMWKGVAEGARTSHVELALDIDPRPNARDKYGTSRRTWKMVGNRAAQVGSTIEKAMGFELNWTDEFHKGGVRAEIALGLEPLVRSGQITQEMAEQWAEQEALYRSFQDDTFANGILGILKNGLNVVGVGHTGRYIGRLEIKQFGLGDLVQKYTQVPGALFTRAVEFSPVGYVKVISLLSQMVSANKAAARAEANIEKAQERADRNKGNKAMLQQVFRAKETAAQKDVDAATAQRNFALAMGRATTGTGLIAAFAAAAAAGILKRADDEDDPNAKALMTSMGVTGTQFNVSAAMRWIDGMGTDWKEGDHLVQVDFLEPMNATMTIGSLIAKEAKEDSTIWEKLGNTGTNNIIGLWQALQEIPTMQTLNTIQQTRQYYDKETAAVGIEPIDIAIEVARGSVTGFVPSPIRQLAQSLDDVQRDTYTSKNVWQQTADALKNSVPILREQLPAKMDNFGQPRRLEDPLLNALNAAFLPGNIRTYRLSDEAEELDRVYKATGEANIFPDRNAPYSKSVKIDGEDIKLQLSKEERVKFQQTRGQESFDLYQKMMEDSFYSTATDSEKAELLAEAKSYANYLAVKELAAGQGYDYTNDKYEKYGRALEAGFTMASWLTTTATAAAAEGEDADGDGKADDGTKKKETLQLIQDLAINDEQKAFWYRGSSYNGDDDKMGAALGQGISASTYIDAQILLADAKGTDNNNDGKTDRGSLISAKAAIINNLPLSAEKKKWLFLQGNSTSTKFANSYPWTDTGN